LVLNTLYLERSLFHTRHVIGPRKLAYRSIIVVVLLSRIWPASLRFFVVSARMLDLLFRAKHLVFAARSPVPAVCRAVTH
jgi:hypothetical protein